MSKTVKTWMTVATLLVVAGLTSLTVIMTVNGWDFSRLATERYETNTYESDDQITDISIKTDTADIVFIPSDNGKYKVTCYETEKVKHYVSVSEGILTVTVVDTRKWYEHIGINIEAPKITVYLPEKEYSSLVIKEATGDIEIPNDFKFECIGISVSTGNVKCAASAEKEIRIKASTGAVSVTDISAGMLDIKTSTGKVTASGISCEGDVTVSVSTGKAILTDIVCKNVFSDGSTGDILLKNVIATERFSIGRDTGDVKLDDSDAAEIIIETDTGDVEGSLLTDKVFTVKTDTGDTDIPKSVSGGRCEITTDTGDVRITIKQSK